MKQFPRLNADNGLATMTQAAGPRLSWLIVPASEPEEIRLACQARPDVIVLDLVEFVTEKSRARETLQHSIRQVLDAGCEVFIQTDPGSANDDLQAGIRPGVNGVVISRAESAQQITAIEAQITRLEAERGIAPGSVQTVIALETATGNRDGFEIAQASTRLFGLTAGRADLIMDLRPEPSGELHLMQFLLQRLVVIARALGARPIGAWWRAPARGLLADAEATRQAAVRGRAIGFHGAMCLQPHQVAALNAGFAATAAARD